MTQEKYMSKERNHIYELLHIMKSIDEVVTLPTHITNCDK
jgi:hypothetical protein